MAYAPQFLHHFEIPIFSSVISWTLTSVEETSLVTRMQTAPTPLDDMCAIVSLDILEVDKIAQVKLIHIRGVDMCVDCSIELTARRVQK